MVLEMNGNQGELLILRVMEELSLFQGAIELRLER